MIDVEAIRKRKTIAERKISDCAVDVPIALSLTDIDNLLDEITRLQALVEWRTDWENARKDGWPVAGTGDPHIRSEWFEMCWSGPRRQWMCAGAPCSPTHFRLITPPESKQ